MDTELNENELGFRITLLYLIVLVIDYNDVNFIDLEAYNNASHIK